MRVVERPDVALELLTKARSHKPGRAKGWHQSDHNRCLRRSVVDAIIDRPDTEIDPGLALRYTRGEGIGAFFAEHRPEDVFYAEGFGWCSIDRPWLDRRGNVVPMELKSTRYSSAEAPTVHPQYVSQLATYVVKKLHRDHIEIDPDEEYEGYLYVLYEMGDYKSNDRLPEQRAFQLLWTGQELLDWEDKLRERHEWLTGSYIRITDHATFDGGFEAELERLRDLLPVNVDMEPYLPPLSEHYDYECEQCPIKELISCPGTKHNAEWTLPFEITDAQYTREHTRKGKK